MSMSFLGHSVWQWALFAAVVVVAMGLDLGVRNKKQHAPSFPEAVAWSLFWVMLAVTFAGWVWWDMGDASAQLFFTGYILEKSLSVDNLAVFIMVFEYFQVEEKYHHRVLYWGVVGAIIMRLIILGAGTVAIAKFHVLLLGCAFLLAMGAWKMLQDDEDEQVDPSQLWIVRKFKQFFPITDQYHAEHFFVKDNVGAVIRLVATPLFLVLLSVEALDLMFATDSIPTVLAVTSDTFILISSNIFAILGLRSLYFVLAALMPMLCHLKKGIALVLAFIAVKLMLSSFADGIELVNTIVAWAYSLGSYAGYSWIAPAIPVVHGPEIDTGTSLMVVGGVLTLAVLASLVWPNKEPEAAANT